MLALEILWDRIAGCLHGLLIGNAIGSPVEGWTAAQIEAEFGQLEQMTEVAGRHWRPRGLHTDDGQQALAVLDAICMDPEHPEQRFAELMVELRDAAPQRSGRWGLHRGVSKDFRHTVRGMQASGLDKPCAHATPSASSGAATRIAPAALWWRDDSRLLNQRVVQLSAVTHSDMRGIMGAQALAAAISQSMVVRSPPVLTQRLVEAVEAGERQAARQLGIPVDHRFSRLVAGLVEQRRAAYHLQDLLTGIEERARAIAEPTEHVDATSPFAPCSVLSALAIVDFSSSFADAVITAINLGGDTDANGAMVGALAGARWGLSMVPSEWLDDLRATGSLLERIERLVDNETGACQPDLLALELQWDSLYDDRSWS
ncbi:ADP-ribosylglycohydrolase family protein [Enhygromyxa salina]|uniref:ADP-ribosyl-[dinitrogen reductase] glycohydrolase n=1 Tax=Enhygromyxa salina TaxID=215803 RepID=A0A2S9YP62_9BACT|nr:ADP-ribosylglycohydrolase family protein [Enhygromyxa salina]PRQ06862.1 ADP-ribosyl-[dinitrogen reductase] glycohydrolase [Enhygromyxa salina]